MDFGDFDCPQFVSFESEAFQRDILNPPTPSTDSLDASIHSNIHEETLVSEDGQSELVEENENIAFTEQSNMEPSILGGMSEDSCLSVTSEELDSTKENCMVHKTKMYSNIKGKPMFRKATVPQPFQFQTDNRVKSKPQDNFEYKEENFTSKLRQNTVLQPKKNHVTKVQPFHLTEGKKRKHTEEFKSLAEQIVAFQKKTPTRYHTSQKDFQPPEHWEPPPLTAKSPELQALKRRRVVNALSKEEQEEKELQEMKKYEFHARPVDPKIYNQPSVDKTKGKVAAKKNSLYLKAIQRAALQKRKNSEKQYKFKARPVPANILSGPVGLKEKQVIPPTKPIAPTFEVESRIEKRKIFEEKRETIELPPKKVQKPCSSGPPPVIPWMKRCTEIQPFSFDKMDKERFLQKEKKIQEEIENEKKAHEFHAQLMPSPMPSALPAVEKKPPTKAEPFNFLLESRSTRQFSFTTEENQSFKAQPATVLTKKPFIPEKPPKLEIEIQEFALHTDRRASERQHLKQEKEAELLEKEQALLLQKAQEEEREHMELMKLRREIVHKANPIRQYKPIEIKPSSVPLTQPEAPDFETDKRLQAKH